MTSKNGKTRADNWLEQAYPQVHYMLLALEGDKAALAWLEGNSKGVADLTRAMHGDKNALAALHAEAPADLDDLFEVQVNGRVLAMGSEGLVGLLGEAAAVEAV